MGGQQSSETPQEDVKVEEKAPEAPKVEEVKEVKEEKKAEPEEPKKNKIPEAKKQSPPKAQPKAPVPPGAQTSTTLAQPKQPPKAAPGAKKKVQQPGPPQQPGLITPDSGKKGGKGEKGEKGKGGKKGGGGFPGIQLCVRNLAKEATPEQLKSMFAPFGELLSVDVKKNTDQTCRGYGFVTFAKMEDAKKAIGQMDNKQVEGKNLVVVLSDRQQGTTKAERESQTTTKGGGKGKDVKGADTKGKGGKGKAKGVPAPATAPASGGPQAWPYQAPPEAYPYNYGGYPVVSPMAAYANQGYPNSQQAAAIAMQASLLQAQQQAIQSQAAWYSSLGQMGLHQQLGGNVPQAPPPTVSLAAAAAPPSAPPAEESRPTLNQEYEGNLKSISSKNGYGFISCNETKAHYKRDVFVDSSILPEGIQVNDKVSFSLSLSEKGHPRATSVKLVGQVMAAR